jgi:hypothetical protein
VPSTLPSQSGVLNPTPYNVSGALDTYEATRIYTRNTVAGAQIASAIGPEAGAVTPRGGALQPGSNVTQPEKYMYFGGAAPDNQNYSPYNTPDANSAAEGKTGGGVTHKTFESSLLTNVLGSQGTSDRSQWRYHQPVYCKTYTETKRSEVPGLMSTPLRAVYRGGSTSYNYNYGGELLANRGGFELLPPDDEVLGCPFPVGCPTSNGIGNTLTPGNILTALPPCTYTKIEWFNTETPVKLGEGATYVVQESDIGSQIYFFVTYGDGSTDVSSSNCYSPVEVTLNANFFRLFNNNGPGSFAANENIVIYFPAFDIFGNFYGQSWWTGGAGGGAIPNPFTPVISKIDKDRQLVWSYDYRVFDGYITDWTKPTAHCLVNDEIHHFSMKSDATDFRYMYLQRLIVDKSTGSIKQITGIRYFMSTLVFFVGRSLDVKRVHTNGSGTYWVAASLPDPTATSAQSDVILKLDTLPDGSLTTMWSYEIISTYINGTLRDEGAATDGFNINEDQNIIYFQGYAQASFRRPTLVVLNASTGAVIYKQPFASVNGDPTILGFRANYIDTDNCLYQVANNSISTVGMKPGVPIWILKKDPNKNIVWMKNVLAILPVDDYSVSTTSMLVINTKLLCCFGRSIGAFTPDQRPHLFLIDTETGNIERLIRLDPSPIANSFGNNISLTNGIRPDEFILYGQNGFYLNLNINNIPLNTSLPTVNPAQVYTFTDLPTTGAVDYVSYTPSILRLPPDVTWPGVGTYYTVPVASGQLTTPTSPTIVSGIYLS